MTSLGWQLVACDLAGSIVHHFKEGFQPSWTAMQIRDHHHPIERLEYRAESPVSRAAA